MHEFPPWIYMYWNHKHNRYTTNYYTIDSIKHSDLHGIIFIIIFYYTFNTVQRKIISIIQTKKCILLSKAYISLPDSLILHCQSQLYHQFYRPQLPFLRNIALNFQKD